MTTPPQDRDLNHLHQSFRTPFERWLADVRAAGFTLLVYETRRTRDRQRYLYAQGRTRPGAIVTYTLNSAHLYGLAADMVLLVNGQADWSVAAYNRVHQAVPPSRYGLELLDFEKPHLQIKGGQDAAPGLGLTPESRFTSVWPVASAPAPVTPAPIIPLPTPVPAQHPVRIFDPATNTQVMNGTLVVGTDKVYILPATRARISGGKP